MKIKSTTWINFFFFSLLSFSLQAQEPCATSNNQFTAEEIPILQKPHTYSNSDGFGTIVWENGTKYEGEISAGKMHGAGKIIYENEEQYDGEFLFGKKEGFGAFQFSCGAEYLGQFKNDQMHGEGVLRLSEKETFSGTWKNGLAEGECTHLKPDGSEFIGNYQEGERNGKGMITFETQDTMRGVWKNGIIEQKSHFKFSDGSSIIHFWEKGKMKEKASYVQPNGLQISAPKNQLAQLLMGTSLGNSETVEDNFSLAWYAAAIEYKNQGNFEGATEQLQFASNFQDIFDDSRIAEWVNDEMEFINAEQKKTGVANKDEKRVKNQ